MVHRAASFETLSGNRVVQASAASSSFLQGSRLLHSFHSVEPSNHRITMWVLQLTTSWFDVVVRDNDSLLDLDQASIKTHTTY